MIIQSITIILQNTIISKIQLSDSASQLHLSKQLASMQLETLGGGCGNGGGSGGSGGAGVMLTDAKY